VSDLFDAPVLDCYKDDPKSIGAAVEWACIDLGIFRGEKVQRSSLLAEAQRRHRNANDGMTSPQHETLGRELRHRNGTRQHFYDRALARGWRIVCEDGRVWAVRV
jgi:hypothetical protein